MKELSGPQPCSVCKTVVEHYVQVFETYPVIDSMLDSIANWIRAANWVRVGDRWHSPPVVFCESCDTKKRVVQFHSDKRITTKLMMDALLLRRLVPQHSARTSYAEQDLIMLADILTSVGVIQKETKRFEREVWYAGLQKIVQASRSTGMSLQFPNRGPKFLLLCSAGRVLMTINAPTHSISLITAEDEGPNQEARGVKPDGEGPMGIQGLCATETEALDLISEAIDVWKSGRFDIKDDSAVGFG